MKDNNTLMKNNSWRGARTMFFLKFMYILIVVVLVLANISIELPNHLPPATRGMDKDTILQLYHIARRIYYLIIANAYLMFGTLAVCIVMAGVFYVYRILWLYRAIKNIRCFTKTFFSPIVAIVCSAIPYIGIYFDVFILRDITRRQQKLLDEQGIQYTPVPRRDLATLFVFQLLCAIVLGAEIADSWPGCFVACTVIVATMLNWLHVLRPCVEQGNTLYQLQQEEIIRTKLEEASRPNG